MPEIKALGASLVAISPMLPDESVKMTEKNALGFEVLSDVGNKVAREFGLVFSIPERVLDVYKKWNLDLSKYNGDTSHELPVPGTFVVTQDGTVHLAFVDADYTHRLEPETLLNSVRELTGFQNR